MFIEDGNVPEIYKPHKLSGTYSGFWECHVKPDWLLIYEVDEQEKLVILTRTGTHADLF
jgi:mRNA interferase YafQ